MPTSSAIGCNQLLTSSAISYNQLLTSCKVAEFCSPPPGSGPGVEGWVSSYDDDDDDVLMVCRVDGVLWCVEDDVLMMLC